MVSESKNSRGTTDQCTNTYQIRGGAGEQIVDKVAPLGQRATHSRQQLMQDIGQVELFDAEQGEQIVDLQLGHRLQHEGLDIALFDNW